MFTLKVMNQSLGNIQIKKEDEIKDEPIQVQQTILNKDFIYNNIVHFNRFIALH